MISLNPLCRALVLCLLSASITDAVWAQHTIGNWAASWASAQTAPYGTEVLPDGVLQGATLRETVHLSTGGSRLAVKVSNVFGDGPLELASVHVALRPRGGQVGVIDPATDHTLLFAGAPGTTLAPGAEVLSDALDFPVAPLSDLVITMVITEAPKTPTLHAGAHATAFLSSGAHAGEAQLPKPLTFTRWYFLSEVEVQEGEPRSGTVIAFGDSITDGHTSTTDGNDRWPDVLARRLNGGTGATPHMGVINEGIGGNRMLADGLGPSAAARLERDLLVPVGGQAVLMLEGINDIGGLDRTTEHPAAQHRELVMALEAGFRQIVLQAHRHGLRVIGGTLTPFLGSDYYRPSPATEADRQALNSWIRSSGTFDGVVDFDAALRDPAHPDHLLPAYDSGDHLHPGPAGYRRMGEVIPLALLTAAAPANRGRAKRNLPR